jgi:hypothetical protein
LANSIPIEETFVLEDFTSKIKEEIYYPQDQGESLKDFPLGFITKR